MATGHAGNHGAIPFHRKPEVGRKGGRGGHDGHGAAKRLAARDDAHRADPRARGAFAHGRAGGTPPKAALAGLIDGAGPAGIIVREIRLPRTLLALLIGATLGLSGAALQGLLRNPLAEPALFGAPQAAAAAASFMIAFSFASATSPGAARRHRRRAYFDRRPVAIAGRRATLTVTLLAGLAFASFAGAMTALILNLAPNPYAALEIAFWLLGSLEDRSTDHLLIAAPFCLVSWILLAANAHAFRALTLGEDAAASLGVDLGRVRLMVVVGVALGVGAAVAVAGSIGFVGLVAPHLVRRAVGPIRRACCCRGRLPARRC